jgi:hypothetical protein
LHPALALLDDVPVSVTLAVEFEESPDRAVAVDD